MIGIGYNDQERQIIKTVALIIVLVILGIIALAVFFPLSPPKPTYSTVVDNKIYSSYNDKITFPVEAFGAHWKIKNFRKNVPFPNGFEEAFPRAVAAAMLFQGAVISIAPRTYEIKSTLFIPSGITIKGQDINSSIIRKY